MVCIINSISSEYFSFSNYTNLNGRATQKSLQTLTKDLLVLYMVCSVSHYEGFVLSPRLEWWSVKALMLNPTLHWWYMR